MKSLLHYLLVCSTTIFYGCSNTADVMTTKELESLINSHLSPGDSHQEIEYFLNERGFSFGYDRFTKRYYSEYLPGRKTYSNGMKEAIGIDIYVDDDKAFKEAVVEKSYTYF